MNQQEALKIFTDNSAILNGHFLLSSGLHSDRYMQCALVLQNPAAAAQLCKELAARFKDDKIDFVIGPALGGILVSYEMARHLGVRSLFAERENGVMSLRRGFSIRPGERCVITEDVITTGKSTNEVLQVVKDCGGVFAGAASLVDRSGGKTNFGVKFESALKVEIQTWKAEECPLCKKGLPLVKPGSRTKPKV
ncbi:MAG: orotate phosphoribosyltransferase [Elusimicrobiales bacterium]|nr:orotate phosphoribosyltransferase [Elusimicrobiales bacterium]